VSRFEVALAASLAMAAVASIFALITPAGWRARLAGVLI
jgi:hypothetical protein